ncbi:hypothetical protein BaRGS_00001034 [Batillaria attramentaria]|uniref:Uncharacterized protein n=1 Tax=Batillaria attramentaria TaxID=370345 RepID=A0ABD0M898_9CAEN
MLMMLECADAAKKSSPGKVNSKPKQAYSTTSAPFDPGNASYSSPQNDQYKAQFNVDAPYSPYPVNPPSYRSAVAMADKDSLLYSPHR